MAISEKTNEIMGVFSRDIDKKVEKADINSIFDGIGEVLTFLGIRLRLSCIDKFQKMRCLRPIPSLDCISPQELPTSRVGFYPYRCCHSTCTGAGI